RRLAKCAAQGTPQSVHLATQCRAALRECLQASLHPDLLGLGRPMDADHDTQRHADGAAPCATAQRAALGGLWRTVAHHVYSPESARRSTDRPAYPPEA